MVSGIARDALTTTRKYMRGYRFEMADTYIDDQGYRRFKDSGMLVHWWVMEQKIGRERRVYLHSRGYVIHHIDGNKLNNNPRNLKMIPKAKHERKHKRNRHKIPNKVFKNMPRWEKDLKFKRKKRR